MYAVMVVLIIRVMNFFSVALCSLPLVSYFVFPVSEWDEAVNGWVLAPRGRLLHETCRCDIQIHVVRYQSNPELELRRCRIDCRCSEKYHSMLDWLR